MIKKLLFCGVALSLLTSVSAQSVYKNKTAGTHTSSKTYNWNETVKTKTTNSKSSVISATSSYYTYNAYVIKGTNPSYSADPVKYWPTGLDGLGSDTTITQAEQFVPNTVALTIDSVSFIGAALNTSASALVFIQDKNLNIITGEVVTIGGFGEYTVALSSPVTIADTFMVVVSPINFADSLVVGVTNDYAPTLPFIGSGYFIEYNSGTFAFENLFTPGNGGGDWMMRPSVTYTFEDVVADKTCLTSNGETVTFTSQNGPALTNPIWNVGAWDVAVGAPVANAIYTQILIAQQPFEDSTQTVGYSHVFPTTANATVEYIERITPWSYAAALNQKTTFQLGLCTGVDEVTSNNQISIYPNPANNFLTIELATANQILNVFDLTGKLVATNNLSEEVNTINISNLENGFYVYTLVNENNIATTGNFVVSR